LKFCLFIIIPWGHVRSRTKFGPDRFRRFNVYWIQLQTEKHVWVSVCIYKWLTVFDQYVNYILCIKGDISYLPVKLKKFYNVKVHVTPGYPLAHSKHLNKFFPSVFTDISSSLYIYLHAVKARKLWN